MVNEKLKEMLDQQETAFKNGKLMMYVLPDYVGTVDIESFIKQIPDGVLYDLNRDYGTIVSIFPENMVFNEMATAKLITWLINKVHELEKKLDEGNSSK